MSENAFYQFAQNYIAPVVRRYARLNIEGAERLPLPGEGALIACNHSGGLWWDALCLVSGLADRRVQFIAHHWDASVRPIKAMLDLVDCSFLDVCEEDIHANCEVVQRLKAGDQMCIYPEESYHSFRHRYTLFQFSPQVIRYARAANVPIVPTAVVGVEEAAPVFLGFKPTEVPLHIPLHLPLILPAKVTLAFGEPVTVAELQADLVAPVTDEALADALRQRVAALLGQYRDCKLSDERYIERRSWF